MSPPDSTRLTSHDFPPNVKDSKSRTATTSSSNQYSTKSPYYHRDDYDDDQLLSLVGSDYGGTLTSWPFHYDTGVYYETSTSADAPSFVEQPSTSAHYHSGTGPPPSYQPYRGAATNTSSGGRESSSSSRRRNAKFLRTTQVVSSTYSGKSTAPSTASTTTVALRYTRRKQQQQKQQQRFVAAAAAAAAGGSRAALFRLVEALLTTRSGRNSVVSARSNVPSSNARAAMFFSRNKDDDQPPGKGSLERLITESYKFLGMADDLNNVASYLSEIRICFIMLTVTTYFLLAIFFIRFCVARSQRRVNGGGGAGGGSNGAILTTTSTGTGPSSATTGRRHFSHNNRTSHWDYQTNTDEYQNAIGAAASQTNIGTTDDLVSVRSDGQMGSGPAAAASAAKSYMGRNHRSQAPSFMRHSHHMNHAAAAAGVGGPQPGAGGTIGVYSATTRLIGAEHLQQQENSTANLRHSASPGAGQPSTPTAMHQSHQQQQQQPHHHHHVVPIPHIVTSGETGIPGGTRMDNNGSSPMGNAVSHASSTTDPNAATSTPQVANQMATLRHHGRAGGGGSLLDRQEITATDM